jgi:hypothetical protein
MPVLPPLPANFPEHLRPLVEELDRRQQAFDALWPMMMEHRRLFIVERTNTAKMQFEATAEAARTAKAELDMALVALVSATGIDLDQHELVEGSAEPIGDPFPRISRGAVVGEAPQVSDFVEDHLPQAIEMIERHAPAGWLNQESPDLFRLSEKSDDEPISIVKGVRLESERPNGHRLRQAMTLARDYLAKDLRYDHFAGALALTQLAQLSRQIEALDMVGGKQQRIDALFSAAETDAIIFELLVASACAAKGRDMVFIEPTSAKSPDLRCVDDFRMIVECKRSSALTAYEIAEEARMRDLFRLLRRASIARGQFGVFELIFSVEASKLNVGDVAATCLRQRLAANPERPLWYAWGAVSFRSLPPRMQLVDVTKAYSPVMLESVFGWNTEMPEWDGLICHIDGASASAVDLVCSPVALFWRVQAEAAIIKRSRAPVGLFAKAVDQIPRGEFGLVYVAYSEGARADIADNRTEAFMERIRDWEHDAGVRLAGSFLVRQYPLPIGHGNPSMIESTVKFANKEAGFSDWIFREYPAAIFTGNG